MRVKLTHKNLNLLFNKLSQQNSSIKTLAARIKISERNLRDWKRGKISLPLPAFQLLAKKAGLTSNELSPKILSDYWHIKKAARNGASARMKLYKKNFGTPEGRKKGGLNSIRINGYIKDGFKILKKIRKPKLNGELAELLGILLGDGHLSKFQASMTTNLQTDKRHALYVKKLFEKLFQISVSLKERPECNVAIVVASSKNLVEFLNTSGMPIGNKIKNNLSAPSWILKNKKFQPAFIRGLFDTDGSIYLDKHIAKKKSYQYMGWTITSYSKQFREDIVSILKNLGYSPTCQITQKSIFLRRQDEIKKYFSEISSHNEKHLNRFNIFQGEVPKRS